MEEITTKEVKENIVWSRAQREDMLRQDRRAIWEMINTAKAKPEGFSKVQTLGMLKLWYALVRKQAGEKPLRLRASELLQRAAEMDEYSRQPINDRSDEYYSRCGEADYQCECREAASMEAKALREIAASLK